MNEENNSAAQRVRTIIGSSIMILIALQHLFRVWSYLKGELYLFYYSYASDIIIPFGIYFLLFMNELRINILRKWYIKAAIILCICTFAEIMQYFGIYALGITFDPIDILMYAIGVAFAVTLDRFIFKRFVPHWNLETQRNIM